MADRKNNVSEGRGMGVGYISLIMLFAVICLTVLASLSYQAARANDKLNEKSISYTNGLYSADTAAKVILSELDAAAMLSFESDFFDDSFTAFCSSYDNLSLRKTAEGYEVSFSEPVSDALSLSVKIVFYSVPVGNDRYEIAEWKTVSVSEITEDKPLGVWDGGAIE